MKSGFLAKIQRYSTRDGPGIRSTVFLTGCNLNCLWCSNPESAGDGPKILYHPERCTHCGACVSISNGSIRPGAAGCVIDREACTNLPDCAAACYFDAYETIGRSLSSGDLAAELARDKAFFDQSGGGVTFSGGEPALQDGFVAETARILRGDGIQVALDTAGCIPWPRFRPLADEADLILYDIKAFDAGIHRACTGADNSMILENAVKLAEMNKDMVIRMILVPGYNDQPADIEARLRFIAGLGPAVRQVDILKLHHLGESKYRSLGLQYPMRGAAECSDAAALEVAKKAEGLGLNAIIEISA